MTASGSPQRFVIPEDLEHVPARWPLGGFRLTNRELLWLVALGAFELVLMAVLVPWLGLGPLSGFALALPLVLGWSLLRLRVDDAPLDRHLMALARFWLGPRLLGRHRPPLRAMQRRRIPDPLYRLDLQGQASATVVRHGWGFRVDG